MDEPLFNLDALLRLNFRVELKRLIADLKTSTIYVTQNQAEAMSLGDRIAIMHQGRIIQCGTPVETCEHPATEFVGGFIGSPPMNFLKGGVSRDGSGKGRAHVTIGGHTLPAPSALASHGGSGDDVLVGTRAENIEASSAEQRTGDTGLVARTVVGEPLG